MDLLTVARKQAPPPKGTGQVADAAEPCRIGVDGFNLALSRGTGVATYARTLSQVLAGMGHKVDVIYGMNISRRTSAALREVIFFDSLDQEHVRKSPALFSRRWWAERKGALVGQEAVEIVMSGRVEARGYAQRMPAHDRILNVPSLFRAAARHYRRTKRFLTIRVPDAPAIMHWTYPLPIRLEGARNIATIHDLVPLRLPYTTLDDKGYHYSLIRDLVRRSDAICTVSEASRRDIVSFYPEAAGKLFNTYQAALPGQGARPRSEDEVAREIGGLFGLRPDGYFLFFGSFEPKKNVGRIIEGFLATDTPHPLVLVGAMAWKSEGELRFLDQGIAQGRIRRLEYLPASTLASLIRAARGVLFPSLTEGFGLPVLEALALGTPLLTSSEGALPEVAGDAAVFVDAYDTGSIAGGIARLDQDEALRAQLRATGPVQAARFGISAYERRLQHMYKAVLTAPAATPVTIPR